MQRKVIMLLVLLAACAFASELAVKVTVYQGTLAVGTNVTVIKEGVELANARADSGGVARFNVSGGSYFVKLQRGGYPAHVSLVEVSGNTNVSLSMRQFISYASVYGIVNGPPDFSKTSVSAFSGGAIEDRAAPNKAGYYMLSFLPGGEHTIVFESPGFANKSVRAFLAESTFTEMNVALERPGPAAPEGPLELSAPSQVAEKTIIEVFLSQGGVPLAGKAIAVTAPSGQITIQTDEFGKARINAAEGGSYTFAYGGTSTITEVPVRPAPQPPAAAAPEPSAQQASPPEPSPQQPSSGSGAIATAAVLAAIGAAVVVLAVVVAVMGKAGKKRQHEGAAKEGKPPPKEQEAAPAGEEHRHAPARHEAHKEHEADKHALKHHEAHKHHKK